MGSVSVVFTASSWEAEARGAREGYRPASLASKRVNKGEGEAQHPQLSSDLHIGTIVCVGVGVRAHTHTHIPYTKIFKLMYLKGLTLQYKD